MEKTATYSVKYTHKGETLQDIQEESQEFCQSLNVLTQSISPQMLGAIAGFIEQDPKFGEFLQNENPTMGDVVSFVTMLAKKYATVLPKGILGKLNPFS